MEEFQQTMTVNNLGQKFLILNTIHMPGKPLIWGCANPKMIAQMKRSIEVMINGTFEVIQWIDYLAQMVIIVYNTKTKELVSHVDSSCAPPRQGRYTSVSRVWVCHHPMLS